MGVLSKEQSQMVAASRAPERIRYAAGHKNYACIEPECKAHHDAEYIRADLVQPSEWQPIETAPKDYSVLIYVPNAEHYGEGIYRAILSSEFGSWTTFGLHVGRAVGAHYWPTHWMLLPDPPKVEK